MNSSGMPFLIEEKTQEVAESIKSCLNGRIKFLQSQGHHFLLKEPLLHSNTSRSVA